ncbi:hypothetical protein B0T10DRAFT_469495 [Thelonectria olida]|uniref:J domain-containing protein n=1 Tax=Thelonectria olida TaxID=1576542 RepID=A0A9P9AXB5_9HYPO|nr:hypothetical protein B0T10DRAFT_469495 [Thelonectria olida]
MNDSANRRGSLRIPRVRPNPGTSRISSARSSGAFDDFRLPSGPPGPSLRARSSRFSLNDQFAATRQEYEFWDDDASSIYERVTNASEAGDADPASDRILVSSTDGFGLVYDITNARPRPETPAWDCYEMLCLPRDPVDLSQERIRRAYYRLFLLFYPDSYPEDLRPIARQQFLRAQEAFETLIDPARRAQYDLGLFLQDESFQSEGTQSSSTYEASFKEAVRDRLQNGIQTSSDLGIRLDATRTGRSHDKSPWQRGSSQLKLLDFALSQSVSVDIPALRNVLQPHVSRLERLTASKEKAGDAIDSLSQPTIEVTTPTFTVSGSVYGVAGDLSLMPTALLYDRYQPLLPLAIPRRRLIQLVENKLSPLVTLRYRQEFLNRAPRSSNDKLHWVKSVIELDADVLPEFSAASRLYHHIVLPKFTEPAVVEASVQSSRHVPSTPPQFVLGLHQNVFHGSAFLRADTGDWALGTRESSRHFADFSKMNPNMFSTESPLKTAPSLELGFRTDPIMHTMASGMNPSNSERGIRGLDHELNTCKEGSWAVSASATPATVAGFVRYSKDLELPFQLPSSEPSTPLMPSTPSSARVEVELCSNTFQDRYLALRNLWSVGRFSRLGLEVGLSIHNLHVSVYWSRLGQRLSIPLLIAPQPLSSPSLFFWAGALPFAGLATLQLFLHHRRGRHSITRSRRRAGRDLSPAAAHVAIARNRYEADSVTVLLARPVEARQKRQIALGGLVILGAKYGVFNDEDLPAGELVADVTIAIAALIDDSSANVGPGLVIPSSVRKSHIPGFWDPAPGKEKALRVHYSYKGIEGTITVHGREELILPPQTARS